MKVVEINCKSALSPSRLMGYDYALNPYRGCEHACVYCYAPYVVHEERIWGGFVDVKTNIPDILSKELEKKKKGVVGISTVTDAYQPIEKRFELTRKCLQQIHRYDFPICIQTKSSLVLRDIDILKKLSNKEVGLTITTIDDDARKRYEPNTSSIEERLAALESLSENKIDTWAFIGPIMPFITDKEDDFKRLISALKKTGVKYVMVDRLNLRNGMWDGILDMVAQGFPELEEKYHTLSKSYFEDVKRDLWRLCREIGLNVRFCY